MRSGPGQEWQRRDRSRSGPTAPSAIQHRWGQIGPVFGVAALGLLVYAKLLQGNAGQRPDPSHRLLFID